MQYTKLRSPEYRKKRIVMTLLPSSSHWQNIQRKDKLLCEETGRGLNDLKLWDMEPHITRPPALIYPRLVVPESLSKLSSLPEYLKELMAPAQQIPVGRELAQHAPGMWLATHLLQNLPNTRKFFSMIIVFMGDQAHGCTQTVVLQWSHADKPLLGRNSHWQGSSAP